MKKCFGIAIVALFIFTTSSLSYGSLKDAPDLTDKLVKAQETAKLKIDEGKKVLDELESKIENRWRTIDIQLKQLRTDMETRFNVLVSWIKEQI